MAVRMARRIEFLANRWTQLDALPNEIFDRRMLAKVQSLVDWHGATQSNSAYRSLLKRNGHDSPPRLSCLADLRDLPVVDKAFIARSAYADSPATRAPVVCVETSGTTSSIVRVPHTRRSIRSGLGDSFLRSLAFGGLGSDSRYWTIGHRAYPGQPSGSYLSFEWLEQVVPARQLLVTSTLADLDRQIDDALELGPDLIASAPGFLTRLAASLLASGENRLRPSVVLYGGAALSDEGRETILRALQPQRLVAFYPTTDCGPIGVSPSDDGNYLVFSESHYVEVVDSTGSPVQAGERGTLLATALDNRAAPLIRYRIGDEVTFLGWQRNRMVVSDIARRGEVSLGDGLLPLCDVQSWPDALSKQGHGVGACQLVIREGAGGIDQPVIRVFTRRAPDSAREVADATRKEFLSNYQLANGVEAGVLHAPVVEVFGEQWSATVDNQSVAQGTSSSAKEWLPETGADGWKQRVVLDER